MTRKYGVSMAILGLILAGCGDGGNTSPTVSSLNVNKKTYNVNDGGGAVNDNFSFKFFDPEADITKVYIKDDGTGDVTSYDSGVFGVDEGTWLGTLVIDTTKTSTTTLEFYVRDDNGNESNHLTTTIIVAP